MEPMLGLEEVAAVREAIAAGQRLDGRELLELPAIEASVGVIEQAVGSALVRMGAAEVLVGVKAEVGAPSEQHPDEGIAHVGVQIAAGALPRMDVRRLDDDGAVFAAQLDQLLLTRGLDSPAIDLKGLGIIRGEAAWVLYIDCIVLSGGGCLLMALGAAVHKALQDTTLPRVSVDGSIEDATQEDIELDAEYAAGVPVDVSRLPVVLSACQILDRVVLAASSEEQVAAHSIVHVSVASDGRICGMLKAGKRMLDMSVLQQLLTTAQRQGRELHRALQRPIDDL